MSTGKAQEQTPPDMSRKKDGVTSTFSAATGDPGRYSGEDTHEAKGGTGTDEDKIAGGEKEEPTGNDEPSGNEQNY